VALEEAWLFLKAGAPPPAWTLPENQSTDEGEPWESAQTRANRKRIETTPGLDRMADNVEADRLEARSEKTQGRLEAMKRPGFLEGLTRAGRKRWKDWYKANKEGAFQVGDDRVQARRLRGTAPDWQKDSKASRTIERQPTYSDPFVGGGAPGTAWQDAEDARLKAHQEGERAGLSYAHSAVGGDGKHVTSEPPSTYRQEHPTSEELQWRANPLVEVGSTAPAPAYWNNWNLPIGSDTSYFQ